MLVVLYAVIREKGKGVPRIWDVFLSHVLLGRTVVFGLCTKTYQIYKT